MVRGGEGDNPMVLGDEPYSDVSFCKQANTLSLIRKADIAARDALITIVAKGECYPRLTLAPTTYLLCPCTFACVSYS